MDGKCENYSDRLHVNNKQHFKAAIVQMKEKFY